MCSDPGLLLTGAAPGRSGAATDFPQELLGLQYRTPAELVREAALLLERAFGGSAAVAWADNPPEDIPPETAAEAVSVPIMWAGAEQAVIRWHAPAAPGRLRQAMSARAAQLGAVLSLRAEAALSRLQLHALTTLREALKPGLPLADAADATVGIAMSTLAADAGAVLCNTASGLKPLTAGSGSAGQPDMVAQFQAAARKVLAAGTALNDGGIVAAPFREQLPVRTMLLLKLTQAPGQLATARAVLRVLLQAAAPDFNYRWREDVYGELLELHHLTGEIPTAELYGTVLQKAVRLVPGAAAGSLFTRSRPDSDFECLSLPEAPLAAPVTGTVTARGLRAWYGAADDGWRLGLPRIIGRSEQARQEPASGSAACSPGRAAASLFLPVLHEGAVLTVLKLDSPPERNVFGPDSEQAVQLFGAPLARLLQDQTTRKALHRAASTDPLTGLLNRRALGEALRRETGRARYGGRGPSVLFMDMRNFKEVNDGHGHGAGDELLVRTGRMLVESLRKQDSAARYGGDEFVALLPETTRAEAERIAERIRRNLGTITAAGTRLSMSIGAAAYGEDGTNPAHLLEAADARMYIEKRTEPSDSGMLGQGESFTGPD